MLVREYTEADLGTIKELHGFADLPNLSSEEFFSRRVIGDSESIGMASFMRLTSEVFLVCNPTWRTPAWRLEAIRQLCFTGNADAKAQGVKEVVGFVSPKIAKSFGRRLKGLGWAFYKDDEYRAFSHRVD